MRAKRMTIFVGESDHWGHQPLYWAILERLKAAGCAGATVTRGLAGFGAHSHIKTAHILDLSFDLPIVVTVVDTPERIEAVLPDIAAMLAGGGITVDETDLRFSSAAFDGGLPDLTVGDIMTPDPQAVTAETAIAEVVEILVRRDYTALPVIDADRRVIGIIADSDLLRLGLTTFTVSMQKAVDPAALSEALAELKTQGALVRDAMTTPAVTVAPTVSVKEAAHLMHTHRLKRLPVVDGDNRLIGILGRLDILQSITAGYKRRMAPHSKRLPQEHRIVSDVMETDVLTVTQVTPLIEILDKILVSNSKRVVVIDEVGRVAGIVTDTDIIRRVDPDQRPGVVTLLRSRWSKDAEHEVRRSYGQRAADVMTSPVVTVRDAAPVIDALAVSVDRHLKRLPVVDADGRVVGMISRPVLLAASLELASPPPDPT